MIQGENVSTAEDTVPCGTFLPFGGVIMRFNNGSLEEEEEEAAEVLLLPTFSAAAQARVVITLMLCVVSTICNGAVLWAGLAKHQAKHSHARILLLHLAGADLLVALVVMPLDAAWNVTVQWWAGDLACRLLMFLKLFAMYASAFITTLISLDRHAAILHPLAITEARRRNQMVLHVAWLLSACLSFPQVPNSLGTAHFPCVPPNQVIGNTSPSQIFFAMRAGITVTRHGAARGVKRQRAALAFGWMAHQPLGDASAKHP